MEDILYTINSNGTVEYESNQDNEDTINLYERCLYGLQYLCKYSKIIRENAGIALFYYINTHKEEKYAKNLRFV